MDPARSSATFTTRHLFGLGKVTGSLALLDGQVTVAADPAASTVQATLASGSFQSDSAGRDKVVKSPGFLDVDGHPHLIFASTGLVQDGPGWLVHGTLTVRGTAAPLELTVTDIAEDHGEVTVHATATVDRYAHGLTKARRPPPPAPAPARRGSHPHLTTAAPRRAGTGPCRSPTDSRPSGCSERRVRRRGLDR